MCGIAGFTHSKRIPDPTRIARAVSSLVHRGPDQQGVFESHAASLGATRLKIIDLAAGDQPITSQSGDTTIVFNGEIYNHAELRAELEGRGHHFRTLCDTEVILEAFLEWDLECFSRLRGMFAVALWTESAKRLVLARDRLGIKPLYISYVNGEIFFGSELKAILIHPEIERNLSMAGLDCYLSLNYVPCPWTLVDGIEKLPPGHWLEWRESGVRSGSYWKLPFGEQTHWDSESAQSALDGLLRQSLRDHLISDVPLGVWLSGGVDSSTILHYAAEASSRRLKTFSITFQGRSFDESAGIREIASAYGTEHEELDLNPEIGLQDAIEEFAYYADEPDADAGALPVWFLSQLTRRHATVALSGEGSDELFGGYLTYRANQLSRPVRAFPSTMLGWALKALQRIPVSDDKIGLEYKIKRFVEGCRMSPDRAHVHWNGTFTDAEKRALVRAELPDTLNAILAGMKQWGNSPARALWFDQRYYLPDDILTKVDRMSMAHAVEVRPPFLDHRIVEFAATLPMGLKIRGSRQKVVLKELMRGKLASAVLRRPKVGFDIPAHDWFRGPLRTLLLDTLASGTATYPSLFRPGVLEDVTKQHLTRAANLGYHLWGVMILFLWMQKWDIQVGSEQLVERPVRASQAMRRVSGS